MIDLDNLNNLLPLFFLYAETHFRFGGWTPSLLFKKIPEIIFDSPKRVDNGKDIPVFLQLNDLKKFPIKLNQVQIVLSQNKKSRIIFNTTEIFKYELKHNFSKNAPTFVFKLDTYLFQKGNYTLTCKLNISKGKKNTEVINNNLRTSQKKSLNGHYAADKFPGSNKCLYGDMHVHSQYTESHVEFCPPIKAIDIAADALGLNFINITDHSYDLSCSVENYLNPDPTNKRWTLFQNEISNTNFKTNVISGEEISVLNYKKEVVHLGGAGVNTFIAGTADGARNKVSKLKNSYPINEVCNKIHKDNGISFAAHPGAQSGFLQRFFLKRGIWSSTDIDDNLDAFQAVNNGFRSGWYRARKLWISKLLENLKIPLIAGNDSHGDFNRYIALSIPFLSVTELDDRYLGYGRTGIYSKKALNNNEILNYIKAGKTFVTTGPFIEICDENENCLISNKVIEFQKITVNASSNIEFGKIDIIRVYKGIEGKKCEELLILKNNINSFNINFEIPKTENALYIRAEVVCKSVNFQDPAMAATSPIYFN